MMRVLVFLLALLVAAIALPPLWYALFPVAAPELPPAGRRVEVSQRRQLIREDLDPVYLTIVLVGLVFFWLDNREHFVQRFGTNVSDSAYLRQVVQILERGISTTQSGDTADRDIAQEATDETGE